MNRFAVSLLGLAVLVLPALGQAERYELGRRLRAFETAWDEQADAEARGRTLSPLKQATTSFFAGRRNIAGKYLDNARFALRSATPPGDDITWAESLAVFLGTRLADPASGSIDFDVLPFYEAGKQPKDSKLVLSLAREEGDGKPIVTTLSLETLPKKGTLHIGDAREGEYRLKIIVMAEGTALADTEQRISLVSRLTDRLAALEGTIKEWPEKTGSTDKESQRRLLEILKDLAANKTLETDYPAHRLIAEAEENAAAIAKGKSCYGSRKTGQFWMVLAGEKLNVPVRVFVPEEAKKDRPLPVVVAIHGLGGTENMFFDAYGRGVIANMCRDRGWLLVSPRSGFKSVKVQEIVQEMGRIYRVDTSKVFLVGHSMGAAQAVEAACAEPRKYAAVAALAGGGTPKPSDELRSLPFFIGVGKEDFALAGARELRARLGKAEVKKFDYREYDIEHLVVVQLAMKDVFAFFDEVAKTK
jgi:predicted esterase